MQEGLNPEPFCDAFKNGFSFALIYCQRIGDIAQTSGFTLCQRMIGDADQESTRQNMLFGRVADLARLGYFTQSSLFVTLNKLSSFDDRSEVYFFPTNLAEQVSNKSHLAMINAAV